MTRLWEDAYNKESISRNRSHSWRIAMSGGSGKERTHADSRNAEKNLSPHL